MYGLSFKKNSIKILASFIFLLGLVFSLVLFQANTVLAQPTTGGNTTPGTTPGTTGTTPQTPATTGQTNSTNPDDKDCAIEKMGWILCPVIETAGKVGDQAFNYLASNFLETEPELVSNSNSGTKQAWEMARNLANIMFVIAFLIIIVSQVTGRGITNYGLKKLLPRLIIAAILVNISYYICQLIVDLTNILGYEIQRFMVNTAAQISDKAAMPVQTSIDNQTSNGVAGGTMSVIATGILGLGLVIWFLLPMLFLGVTTVVVTCIVIVLILLMRKAFIVLLIVVSPIAFVLYLLPNTEKYYQKWQNMFVQLLLVFPIVGLLFGGGQLASAIVLVAGSSGDAYKDAQTSGGKCIQLPSSKQINTSVQNNNGTNANPQTPAANNTNTGASIGTCTQGSTPFLLGLVAAGIAVAPMIAVWAVLKGALSAAGSIGGKIAGAIQSGGRGAEGIGKKGEAWAKKRAGENMSARWQNMQARGFDEKGNPSSFAGRRAFKRAMRDKRLELAKSDLDRNKNQAIANILSDKDKATALTSGLSTRGQEAAAMNAVAAQRKTSADEVAAQHVTVDNLDAAEARAAAQEHINKGEFDSPHLAALLEHLGKLDQKGFMDIATQISGKGPSLASNTAANVMGGMNGLYGGSDAAEMRNGKTAFNLQSRAQFNLNKGSVSSNDLTGLSTDAAKTLKSLVAGDAQATAHVQKAVADLSKDQRGQINQEKQQIIDSI